MSEILMPRLSDSMEEGTLLRWLAADRSEVAVGDELAEIETDKATVTYEVEVDGVLRHVAAAGDTLAVGALLAHVLDRVTPTRSAAGGAERIKVSPRARRVARERGIDLAGVVGSGPGGRIVLADVEAPKAAPAPSGPLPSSLVAESAAVPPAKPGVAGIESSPLQQVVARRMVQTSTTVPDFAVTVRIDMQRCADLRRELEALGREVAPSFDDLVVKAAASALRAFPRANGAYRDGRFELHDRCHVGMTVAAPDRLVVPTIFDADEKALAVVARESRALAAAVRDGTVAPQDLSGATFTVSNLGMYGIAHFTAVIDVPQAAILTVGAVVDEPVVRRGTIVVRPMMNATLVCDHRILYGADAAQFLAHVRTSLEAPIGLLI
jgi:pyruvate dehydrogenase E2 component (dihydrolipoamide acetyltransferase)